MRFKEFWPIYLHAHRQRATRAAHYAATLFGGSMAAVAFAVEELWVLPAGIAGSYAMAILSHWRFERNQPLILVNPLWGAVADLRMCWLAATGGLGRELARHGVVHPRRGERHRPLAPTPDPLPPLRQARDEGGRGERVLGTSG